MNFRGTTPPLTVDPASSQKAAALEEDAAARHAELAERIDRGEPAVPRGRRPDISDAE